MRARVNPIHDEVTAKFCDRVMSAYEGPDSWHDRIWAAGWAAMKYFREDPVRARFLMVEVNGAGISAQAHRDRLMQRLADLLDAGRDELENPGSVSRCTAEVAAGAIYGTILTKIEAGWIDRGEEFLPELVYMAVMPYLGARDSWFRPAHIHVSLFNPGFGLRLITQCYFEGDPLIRTDPIVQAIPDPRGIERLIARMNPEKSDRTGEEATVAYDWDIVIRGREATPMET